MKLTKSYLKILIQEAIDDSFGGSDVMASRRATRQAATSLETTRRIIQLIQKLPRQTPEELRQMKLYTDRLTGAMNKKTPAEREKDERDIEDELKGLVE